MKSPVTLVIDSSTPTLFLGLLQGEQILGHHVEVLDRRHAEMMLPRLIEFLNRYQLILNDVSEVVVGHGPGSFTGVRLALTLIKTLALIQPLRVFPISTLQLFAFEPQSIISLDARGERHYVGVYRGQEVLVKPQIVLDQDFAKLTEQFPKFKMLTIPSVMSQPERILQHIQQFIHSQSPLKDVQTLNPLYLKELI